MKAVCELGYALVLFVVTDFAKVASTVCLVLRETATSTVLAKASPERVGKLLIR